MNRPPMIELKTNPLGFLVSAGGNEYWLPLNPVAAQSLALALLAQPGVGVELKPELRAVIAQETEALKRADAAFLAGLGVTA